MTKSEFARIAAAMKTYYPREALLPNDMAMELWYFQLSDISYRVAEAALNKWVANNRWSPSIADLREISQGILYGDLPDWGESWRKTQDAIRRFGYYQEDEALASLDDLTRDVVERLGFRNLCLSENHEASRANFRQIFEQVARRRKEEKQIPAHVMEMIRGIAAEQRKNLEAKESGKDNL